MTIGRSIRLFLADGTPGGVITAEIMNWTGHVLVAPRSRLVDLIQRSEAGRTGVYFLIGPDPEGSPKPLVYIGEGDNVGKRLAHHNKDEAKDFWEQTCTVSSKDQNLTKAHARYLESRLIAIATEASRAKLVNGTAPDATRLPEADIADMEFFIEQLRIVLPVLGLTFLQEAPKLTAAGLPSATAGAAVESPLLELVSAKHNISAEAREVDGGFVVLAGSRARGPGSDSRNSYRELRQSLEADGTLRAEAGYMIFTKDVAFRSPSAAAAVLFDRNANGRTAWVLKGSRTTYGAWQEQQVAAVAGEDVDE